MLVHLRVESEGTGLRDVSCGDGVGRVQLHLRGTKTVVTENIGSIIK